MGIPLNIHPHTHPPTTHLIRPEGLLGVGALQELGNGENVGAGVHHDEEEHTSGETTREVGVVLEYDVDENDYPLD